MSSDSQHVVIYGLMGKHSYLWKLLLCQCRFSIFYINRSFSIEIAITAVIEKCNIHLLILVPLYMMVCVLFTPHWLYFMYTKVRGVYMRRIFPKHVSLRETVGLTNQRPRFIAGTRMYPWGN